MVPITLMSMQRGKPLLTIANLEIFLNTVNHCLIAITTFYLTWYCIKSGFSSQVSYHALLTTIGYQLLMSEGILVLYKQNSYTFNVDSRGQKTTMHWVLLALGSLLAVVGMAIEMISKQRAGRLHFHSTHSLWGELAAMIFQYFQIYKSVLIF